MLTILSGNTLFENLYQSKDLSFSDTDPKATIKNLSETSHWKIKGTDGSECEKKVFGKTLLDNGIPKSHTVKLPVLKGQDTKCYEGRGQTITIYSVEDVKGDKSRSCHIRIGEYGAFKMSNQGKDQWHIWCDVNGGYHLKLMKPIPPKK